MTYSFRECLTWLEWIQCILLVQLVIIRSNILIIKTPLWSVLPMQRQARQRLPSFVSNPYIPSTVAWPAARRRRFRNLPKFQFPVPDLTRINFCLTLPDPLRGVQINLKGYHARMAPRTQNLIDARLKKSERAENKLDNLKCFY